MGVQAVLVVSRNAAAVHAAWRHDALVRRQIVAVVSDRDCPAEQWARAEGIPTQRIEEPDNERFSDRLADHMEALGATHAVLAFTRLLRGTILERYRDRILNLHPGLLPAFKGLGAFEQARASGVRFVGSTLHLIDAELDAGRIVLQAATGLDWAADERDARKRQFAQLAAGLVQVLYWLEQDRVVLADPGTRIRGASFGDGPFSPALDVPSAQTLYEELCAEAHAPRGVHSA